jgi:acyl-CoA thioesterase-1
MLMKRKNFLSFLLLAIVTAALLTACSSSPKLPHLGSDATILAFGDSLTFGTGAGPTESYPAVLETIIGRRVVNAGVPGEVTAEGLARLAKFLDEEKPALLLLCHGGNDLLRRLDRKQAANNIREMIRLARNNKVAVVLIAVPGPGLPLSPPPMYQEIAKELSIPIEEEVLSTVLANNSLKSDPIHPNAAGYRRIAASIAALLKKSGAVK